MPNFEARVNLFPKQTYNGFYVPGDYIRGVVLLDIRRSTQIRTIRVHLTGTHHFELNMPTDAKPVKGEGGYFIDDKGTEYLLGHSSTNLNKNQYAPKPAGFGIDVPSNTNNSKSNVKMISSNIIIFEIEGYLYQAGITQSESSNAKANRYSIGSISTVFKKGLYEYPFIIEIPEKRYILPSVDYKQFGMNTEYKLNVELLTIKNFIKEKTIKLEKNVNIAVPGKKFYNYDDDSDYNSSIFQKPFIMKLGETDLKLTLVFEARFYHDKIFTINGKLPPFGLFLVTTKPPEFFIQLQQQSGLNCKDLRILVQKIQLTMYHKLTIKIHEFGKKGKFPMVLGSGDGTMGIVDLSRSRPVDFQWNETGIPLYEVEITNSLHSYFSGLTYPEKYMPSFGWNHVSLEYDLEVSADFSFLDDDQVESVSMLTDAEVGYRVEPTTRVPVNFSGLLLTKTPRA